MNTICSTWIHSCFHFFPLDITVSGCKWPHFNPVELFAESAVACWYLYCKHTRKQEKMFKVNCVKNIEPNRQNLKCFTFYHTFYHSYN